MKPFKFIVCTSVFTLLLAGCKKTDVNPKTDDYSFGVYIVDEGNFTQNNGSITFFNPQNGVLINNIFEAANQRPVGDVVQSFAVVGDTTGYIVVNGSGKIEVVRLKDFRTTSAPVPVFYPRHFLQVSADKGYLTAGSMAGKVYVFNLQSRQIVDSVSVGYGPETMVARNNRVYVANSGGWSVDSTLSVLDVNTDQVVSTYKVGLVPVDLALDEDQNLWVYCKGLAQYDNENLVGETDASLIKMDPSTGNILWQHVVGKAGDYTAVPPRLAVSSEGDKIYYTRPDGVYRISARNPVPSSRPLVTGSFYGMDVNPLDNYLYLFEANFAGDGTMDVYDTTGNARGKGTVGVGPNGAVFHLQ